MSPTAQASAFTAGAPLRAGSERQLGALARRRGRRRTLLRDLRLLAAVEAERGAEAARTTLEKLLLHGALLVLMGLLVGASCLLLLLGASTGVAVLFALPVFVAHVLVGGVLLGGAAFAVWLAHRAGQHRRLDRYALHYGTPPPTQDGTPAEYLAAVERTIRRDAQRSALRVVARRASPGRLALVGVATFALGFLLRRWPVLTATVFGAALRRGGRRLLVPLSRACMSDRATPS
jgi:hypothetical protein